MKKTIYIAASWKHQHAVEMLTTIFREKGFDVKSFVENSFNENYSVHTPMPFEEWMKSDGARRAFIYDTTNAMQSDAIVYIGPSGKDAACELGMAYASGKPIFGLWAKGEDFGLMRKIIRWHERHTDLVDHVTAELTKKREPALA
jgi:hypothetical protein